MDTQPLPLDAPWWTDNGDDFVRDLLSSCLQDESNADWQELAAQLSQQVPPSPAAFAALPHLIGKLEGLSLQGASATCHVAALVLANDGESGRSACPATCEVAFLHSIETLKEIAWAVAERLHAEPAYIPLSLLSAVLGAKRLSRAIALGWEGEECEFQCPRCDEYALLSFSDDGISSHDLGPPMREVGEKQPGNCQEHPTMIAEGAAMLRAPRDTWSERDLCCALAAFSRSTGHQAESTGLLFLAGNYACCKCGKVTSILDGRDNT